ncbi:aldehyde dehydrogenase domain-containing protein [Podospora conica]|nr:aldehyde dehydrogenase domain-containing protein [Schizothecium conicum]
MAELASFLDCDTLEKAHVFMQALEEPIRLDCYIGGLFGYAETENIPLLDSFEPKTGRLYARMPITQEAGVELAIDHAKKAFPAWSKTTRAYRSDCLRRIADLIQEHREHFAVWESIDQGKSLERARVEVDRAVSNFSYFSTYILHEQTPARMIDATSTSASVLTYEHRSPVGVFALISPWNMPLYLLTWKIAPCLAFGCTAVAKPSEITSMSAFYLALLIHTSQILPPGVLNIILGDGPTTGAALVASPNIAGVSFTGGTATGIAIRKATAHQIGKHLSLELGGKNPLLLFSDALVPTPEHPNPLAHFAALAATAAFTNQGEICLCTSRIYVEKASYPAFLAAFTAHVRGTYVPGTETMGALASRAHYDKVRSYLSLAYREGATFQLGSVPPEEPEGGYWVGPVVLTGVSPGSAVLREEIFGPVVVVVPFEGEEEGVKLANDSGYGLAAVVVTKDGGRMRRVGEAMEAGVVWVNGWLQRELGTPFGGVKGSGEGREGGEYSRGVFTVVKTMHLPGY